jgi:hypothetical protein
VCFPQEMPETVSFLQEPVQLIFAMHGSNTIRIL